MIEVLVYVYENYWHGEDCPAAAQLERKLNAIGFDANEVRDALIWLDGLDLAAQSSMPQEDAQALTVQPVWTQSANSLRVYSVAEQNHLGGACLGFIRFLESAGVLPAVLREVILDRAMAVPGATPMKLEDLKVIILMVYWRLGHEPDALILDELCEDHSGRLAH